MYYNYQAMIIFIHGSDQFRSRAYLREQISKFKVARDPQGYNVVLLNATQEEPGKILNEISSAPFLAPRRMIVVENILNSKDVELLGELIRIIQNNRIPESNIVVFWQGDESGEKEKKSTKKNAKTKPEIEELVSELKTLLLKEKYNQEFLPLDISKIVSWLEKECVTRGGKISKQAAMFLVMNSSGDMWLLDSLLSQLVAYKQKEEIVLSDVQLFIEEKVDDNAFNMVEAVVSGNGKLAYKLLEEQKRIGEEDQKIFGLLVWQFRLLLQLRSLYDVSDRVTSDEAAKTLKIHPFVAKKNWAIIKKYPLTKLKDIYSKLLDIDIKSKTGQGDAGLLMDFFVGTPR